MGPLKNGFAASQKSFPLRGQPDVIMIHDEPLTSSLERRKTFDSPLANHFSAVIQNSHNLPISRAGYYHGLKQSGNKIYQVKGTSGYPWRPSTP
jgi:hypothetical protein